MAPRRATCTCFCGTVQIELPVEGPDMLDSFICNCTDCHKITASAFASNFIVADKALVHVRGQDKMSKYSRSDTIESGNTMTNHFCSVCGSLLYRVSSGFPGLSITRIGTLDDYELQSTLLKPRVEQYCKDRLAWLPGGKDVPQVQGASKLGKKHGFGTDGGKDY